MKRINQNNILVWLFMGAITLFTSSCDSYLNELPDNRTEIDTKEKIAKILVSAYPQTSYIMLTELASDNVDDYGPNNPYTERFYNEVAYWIDTAEMDNDNSYYLWSYLYMAISNANQALEAIKELGDTSDLKELKGEALLCRAYAHFLLVNVFGMHYNSQTSETDLGIVYMEKTETELNPWYERQTVAENYRKINDDIEEALPLIENATYSVPKYHFNRNAAYAFAARFNLYYCKWDKVIEYANQALGSNPQNMLRDMTALSQMTFDETVFTLDYIKDSHKCNFLLSPTTSYLGYYFSNWGVGARITHGSQLAEETIMSRGPWGDYYSGGKVRPFIYTATNFNKVLHMKLPIIWEYTDPVAQTGFVHTVYVPFTAEETLLCRAEAYVMKEDFTKAVDDLNVWRDKYFNTSTVLTPENIISYYRSLDYYTPTNPTVKKELNPKFDKTLTSDQENLIHGILHIRRIVTVHEGLRWFDIKRYGIEVHRRLLTNNGGISVAATLPVDDPRRAIQLPSDVISAGLAANPR